MGRWDRTGSIGGSCRVCQVGIDGFMTFSYGADADILIAHHNADCDAYEQRIAKLESELDRVKAEHPAAGPWMRTKKNPPEVGKEYWVITHSLKRGHRPGVGYLISKELGWSVNGSAGGPPKLRPRVVWHAEIIYPEIGT